VFGTKSFPVIIVHSHLLLSILYIVSIYYIVYNIKVKNINCIQYEYIYLLTYVRS
jgi:hypothetical protein